MKTMKNFREVAREILTEEVYKELMRELYQAYVATQPKPEGPHGYKGQ